MQVQVVSPERVLWSGEAERIVTRVVDEGDIAFLPGHTTYLGQLGAGVTEIAEVGGEVIKVAVHGGFVEVSDDRVSLLSDQAELATEIDIARAQAARERAQVVLRGGDDEEATWAAKRAETRLRATGHDEGL